MQAVAERLDLGLEPPPEAPEAGTAHRATPELVPSVEVRVVPVRADLERQRVRLEAEERVDRVETRLGFATRSS